MTRSGEIPIFFLLFYSGLYFFNFQLFHLFVNPVIRILYSDSFACFHVSGHGGATLSEILLDIWTLNLHPLANPVFQEVIILLRCSQISYLEFKTD